MHKRNANLRQKDNYQCIFRRENEQCLNNKTSFFLAKKIAKKEGFKPV